MTTPAGSLHYLLVIANPDALTPYDPASTDLPGDEHYYITSRRRISHPWIAQRGTGPNAVPDIAIGGQRLEMPLGRSIDGECQVRVIDEPAPVTTVACDITDILIPEGDTDLHLDGTAFSSGKWEIEGDQSDPTWAPESEWSVSGSGPNLNVFSLFFWVDIGVPPYVLGTWVRSTWIKATFDGTEGGGVAWTPGQKVGFRFRVNWTLDTGGGNVFVELQGAGAPIRVSGLSPLFDFWTIPVDPNNNQVDNTVYAIADASGEVVVKMGLEGAFPSFNVAVQFTDTEVVSCEDVVVTIDSEAYTTASLADDDARQKQLGRPYYFKVSTDGGFTFDEMLYAGFLRDATMERSKTFLMTGGDAGRGRRLAKAWRDLDPIEDFTP